MTDEGGVLGNLPNSRPGRRSAKRDRAAAKPARAAKAARAAKPARAAKATQAARPPRRTAAVKEPGSGDGVDVMHDMDAQRRHDSPGGGSGDPLSAAVRTAAGLAVTGVKVGGAVTKELFRRLPRP